MVCVRAACAGGADGIRMILRGFGSDLVAEVRASAGECEAEIAVPKPALWAPGSPNLYDLTLEATRGGETVDRYSLPIGIREVAVTTDAILLNGKPVYLKGFGRHEDFPVAGRGFLDSVAVKDCALMEWVGANSFRTTHYPYGETTMDLADRLGFLVIDETPAVGLFFLEEGLSRRLELCKSFTRELIARDKNHPSVIAWSLANEPHSKRAGSREFFRELFAEARSLDPTRPATMASYIGAGEPAYEFSDFVCLNRYSGWYSFSGQIDEGCAELSRELDEIRRLPQQAGGAHGVRGGHGFRLPRCGARDVQRGIPGEVHREHHRGSQDETLRRRGARVEPLRLQDGPGGEALWGYEPQGRLHAGPKAEDGGPHAAPALDGRRRSCEGMSGEAALSTLVTRIASLADPAGCWTIRSEEVARLVGADPVRSGARQTACATGSASARRSTDSPRTRSATW